MTETKRCPTCGIYKPATSEYFAPNKRLKYGLASECRACKRHRDADYNRRNRDRVRAQQARWYQENKQQRRLYNQSHREQRRHQQNTRYHQNPEPHKRSHQRWRRANPQRAALIKARYIARKHSLPDTLTQQQWHNAIAYFDGCCAYCDRPLGEHPTLDHIIPISNPCCPGTVAWNSAPCCVSCNTSKKDKDLEFWLIEKYGDVGHKPVLQAIREYQESCQR